MENNCKGQETGILSQIKTKEASPSRALLPTFAMLGYLSQREGAFLQIANQYYFYHIIFSFLFCIFEDSALYPDFRKARAVGGWPPPKEEVGRRLDCFLLTHLPFQRLQRIIDTIFRQPFLSDHHTFNICCLRNIG